ncbi:MAG TPA: NnrS family protein, partial [Anaeromyxobacteraceae bacterium]|nr:NnrS family protein [Anaeromyxobacteraceae bacterium]
PRLRGAALHVLFVGGFAQLALAVATHVALSHGGRADRLRASPAPLRVMAALLAAAFGGRILAGIDLSHVAGWLALAGTAFTGAVGAWAVLVVPALRPSAAARAPERSSTER